MTKFKEIKKAVVLPITKAIQKRRTINSLENKIEVLEDVIKNELYKAFIGNIKDKDKIEVLKKENERLKEINKEQANHLISKDNLSYKDYKSRNEKAIEYIYHWSTQRKKFFNKIDKQLNGKPQFYGDIADLLNILQGSDDK